MVTYLLCSRASRNCCVCTLYLAATLCWFSPPLQTSPASNNACLYLRLPRRVRPLPILPFATRGGQGRLCGSCVCGMGFDARAILAYAYAILPAAEHFGCDTDGCLLAGVPSFLFSSTVILGSAAALRFQGISFTFFSGWTVHAVAFGRTYPCSRRCRVLVHFRRRHVYLPSLLRQTALTAL